MKMTDVLAAVEFNNCAHPPSRQPEVQAYSKTTGTVLSLRVTLSSSSAAQQPNPGYSSTQGPGCGPAQTQRSATARQEAANPP